MAKTGKPRSGSLQFWPRKRAKKELPRIRKLPVSKENKLLSFIGYKAGMTHVMANDTRKTSMTKGETISFPVTIVECPPLKIASSRFYKQLETKLKLVSEVFNPNLDKDLKKKINLPKEFKAKEPKSEEYTEVRVLVYTQPRKTPFGKKRPDLLELSIGGTKEEQLKFIKDNLNKEISLEDVFEEGILLDSHGVTIGKGFQGPVKRFGIALRSHKSEKARRNPGSLGPWKAHAHIMWRVAHAGQTGYHTRTEYNKQLIKISNDPKEIEIKGGIRHYGNVKSTFMLIHGSIQGPKKRAIVFTPAIRPPKKHSKEGLQITHINL